MNEIMFEVINWEDFFNGAAYEDISKMENSVWLVEVNQDISTRTIDYESMLELDPNRRIDYLLSDCYLESENNIVTRYHFLYKMQDSKSNLIIFSNTDRIKIL